MIHNPASNAAGAFMRTGGKDRYAFIEIVPNQVQIDRLMRAVGGVEALARAYFPPALNKTAVEARNAFTQILAGRMNISRKKSIKDRLRHSPKANRHSWRSGIAISLDRFTVTSFKGTRQVMAGVQWQPETGKTRLIPRAFIRQGFTHYKSGGHVELRQAWRRAGGFGKDAKLVPRRPLFVMRGPSLAKIFSDDAGLRAAMSRQASAILDKKIDQQIDRIVGKI